MNVHSQANRGCVQLGCGTTGSTYKETRDFVERSRPVLFILENVTELSEKTEGMAYASDEEFILSEFRTMGFAIASFRFNCAEYGSRCDRERLYFVGVQCETKDEQVPIKFFRFLGNVLDSMKVDPLPFSDFAMTATERMQSWQELLWPAVDLPTSSRELARVLGLSPHPAQAGIVQHFIIIWAKLTSLPGQALSFQQVQNSRFEHLFSFHASA